MAYIFSFVLSVAANVASYYICKWLDGAGRADPELNRNIPGAGRL